MKRQNLVHNNNGYILYAATAHFARIFVFVAIIVLSVVWLCGALLDGIVAPVVTVVAAVLCTALLLLYCVVGVLDVRGQERRYHEALVLRKARTAEIENTGFSPTFKSIGSSRMFAVDEKMGKWFLLDYHNNPMGAKLHSFSSIRRVFKATNKEYIPSGHRILLFNARRLNKKDARNYFSKIGVVIELYGQGRPYEFVNCFKTENDADIIITYLQSVLKREKVGDLSSLIGKTD